MHDPNPPTASAANNTRRLARALERNIDALVKRRTAEQRSAGLQDRLADAITRFVGSMMFVYIHLVFFGLWILINTGVLPIVPAWDSSLVILAMEASVEAIFLSTFVLISQNRMAVEDTRRAELDLQISLLNEHETTRLLQLVSAIAEKLDIRDGLDEELRELKQEVEPEQVLDRLDSQPEGDEAKRS